MASDIRAYLAEQGLTAEEIAALVGNEKAMKAMSAALGKYDEGVTLSASAHTDLEKAEAAKVEAEDFWEKKVTPALAGVDRKIATATSEAAKYKAYLQSLKDQGYDVPADLLTAPTTATTTTATRDTTTGQFTRDDFNKEMQGTAEAQIAINALSQRYQYLYGEPYLTMEEDYAAAKAAHKPLREFVAAKYKFEEKTTEKKAAAEQKRIDAIVAERVKVEEAKLQAKYGSNAETRAPLASKFDKIEKIAERKDSWKSSKGRDEARKGRLAKFENLTLQ
jgi:hypothetical protein